mgnify:CR=1 FL=1
MCTQVAKCNQQAGQGRAGPRPQGAAPRAQKHFEPDAIRIHKETEQYTPGSTSSPMQAGCMNRISMTGVQHRTETDASQMHREKQQDVQERAGPPPQGVAPRAQNYVETDACQILEDLFRPRHSNLFNHIWGRRWYN